MAHYAEAFSVIPGVCFRFTRSSVGHAAHCREPVIRRGEFVDGAGKKWQVDACAEHADELSGPPNTAANMAPPPNRVRR